MLRDIPIWFRVLFAVFLVGGIAIAVYTFKECGARAFLLGNGALYAAVSGMCE
jgi:hypothetical protein